MARQRDRVRIARVLRALLVGAIGSLAATMLFEQDLGRDLVAPLWLVTWAPPAFYLLLGSDHRKKAEKDKKVRSDIKDCDEQAVDPAH